MDEQNRDGLIVTVARLQEKNSPTSVTINGFDGQNAIENHSEYKDYLNIEIFDPDENIKPYSLLTVDGKDYQIVSSNSIDGNGLIKVLEVELVEVLNTAVNTSVTSQNLTSVDGESGSESSQVVTPNPGVGSLQEVTDVGATTTDEITVPSIQVTSAAKIQDVTGSHGSIEVDGGAHTGYEGYSIGGRVVFMHDNSTTSGLFNTVNGEWLFSAAHGGASRMYWDGVVKIATVTGGVNVTGTLTATGEVESFDTSDIRLKENIKELNESETK